MKDKRMLHMLDAIDDDLIQGAIPKEKAPKKKGFKFRFGILAACLCCALLLVSITVILPLLGDGGAENPHISAQIEDYDDIREILKNYTSDLSDMAPGGAVNDGSPEDSGGTNSSSGGYVEVTDNQENGVIEGDLFKRTTTHLFYLRENELCVYSIDKEKSQLVGKLDLDESWAPQEMYLSEDGKSIVIISVSGIYPKRETHISVVNVSSPQSPRAVKNISISGDYISSRYTNNEFLVFTRFYVKNLEQYENFIPSVDTGEGCELVPVDSIYSPGEITCKEYFTASKLDSNLEYSGSVSLLSFSSVIYVSQENIYATRSYREKGQEGARQTYKTKSEIVQISYTGSLLNVNGSVEVDGSIKDQYCMDEKDGILRVFTTVNEAKLSVYASAKTQDEMNAIDPSDYTAEELRSDFITSASLYCIDLKKMSICASVVKFAPKGESVQSARFDGDKAYVCTAVVFDDPVFVFDLSDLNNITYKDTGTIQGYSHSLIELGNGYLLGIGQSDRTTTKIELYKETENSIVSVDVVELEYGYSSSNYKAYYINREKGVFGFAYYDYNGGSFKYYNIYEIIGEKIVLSYQVKIDMESYGKCRGVLIDGYYYILTDSEANNFYVKRLH